MELATRTFSRRFVNGLSKCIERDLSLTSSEATTWKVVKEKGLKLFTPEGGGSYEVFNKRPMDEDLVAYCTQDVSYLPKLWKQYQSRLGAAWAGKVETATVERVRLSQSASYNPKGDGRAFAPAGWL
jgi:exonuclease 3'-5' domain-containing protein 1